MIDMLRQHTPVNTKVLIKLVIMVENILEFPHSVERKLGVFVTPDSDCYDVGTS